MRSGQLRCRRRREQSIAKRGVGAGASAGSGSRPSLGDDAGVPGFDPNEELDVPSDQRPVNELKEIRDSPVYAWAELPAPQLYARLGMLFGTITALLSMPIAGGSFVFTKEPLKFILSALDGSFGAMTAILLRMYLGWSHIGNRLLSAVVEYEETGWYDGQRWVKPPRVLQRDRLLGLYEVKPCIDRMKRMLIVSASGVALCSTLLVFASSADAPRGPRFVTPQGPVFRQPRTNEDSEDPMSAMISDDEAARNEQEALQELQLPAYCFDEGALELTRKFLDVINQSFPPPNFFTSKLLVLPNAGYKCVLSSSCASN